MRAQLSEWFLPATFSETETSVSIIGFTVANDPSAEALAAAVSLFVL